MVPTSPPPARSGQQAFHNSGVLLGDRASNSARFALGIKPGAFALVHTVSRALCDNPARLVRVGGRGPVQEVDRLTISGSEETPPTNGSATEPAAPAGSPVGETSEVKKAPAAAPQPVDASVASDDSPEASPEASPSPKKNGTKRKTAKGSKAKSKNSKSKPKKSKPVKGKTAKQRKAKAKNARR